MLNEIARYQLEMQLRALRLTARLSQMQVASGALGFTKSHAAVSRLERGILLRVDTAILAKLMRFLQPMVPA